MDSSCNVQVKTRSSLIAAVTMESAAGMGFFDSLDYRLGVVSGRKIPKCGSPSFSVQREISQLAWEQEQEAITKVDLVKPQSFPVESFLPSELQLGICLLSGTSGMGNRGTCSPRHQKIPSLITSPLLVLVQLPSCLG